MNVRTFLTVAAIIALLFGIGFVLIPIPLASLFGVALNPHLGIAVAAAKARAVSAWSRREGSLMSLPVMVIR